MAERPRRVLRLLLILAALLVGVGMSLSYYVDGLWFASLGYEDVFWRTLTLQSAIAAAAAIVTFGALYGAFLALKPSPTGRHASTVIMISGQPIEVTIDPILKLIAFVLSALIALITATGMGADWWTFALWWMAPASGAAATVDPIFGRPIGFYLFTLPAWNILCGWLLTLAVLIALMALVFTFGSGAARIFERQRTIGPPPGRGFAIAWAFLLLIIAFRVWLGRFDLLFEDHGILTGVGYTDAHINAPGALIIAIALLAGAAIALASTTRASRVRWLVASVLPAFAAYVIVGAVAAYVNSFVVKPNQLVKETPYLAHNIAFTRQAYALDHVTRHAFPATTGVEAVAAAENQATLQNIRLWDWRALQDTLRQIQEIRTYYDFPDIDIDRYVIDGQLRQVMLGTRELNVNRLPGASRTWVNEKLIYTHGYGVTMNTVNGFTAEGLPRLILSNMPVESTSTDVRVTRPEIYFGELTTEDVYVKTRQQEFNYPQGQSNELTSYAGTGGIVLGGWLRRLLISIDRGDLAKIPFSDDIESTSRLLMRRDIRSRLNTLAPFLTFDPDPYIVVGKDGRLSWIVDGFTTSSLYPYSRAYHFNDSWPNYVRNSVKAVIDAYDGTTTFYVFDPGDPLIAAYRGLFPTLFKDASAMPPDLRAHVRYPEMLLSVQADAYGLYHMTDPEVFYNREDLWTVASEVATQQGQEPSPMEPNFVLMSLPEEHREEFVEILPFTPANRNNMIGWIAGRSDAPHYGEAVVYDFPKTKLVDGPLQVEARIDQDPQLSQQLSLWNQQGSRVRRGNLLVIPIGRGLLYAEPIYLQAERSPMPELRIVVLALQDKLAYGPTYEAALTKLFGEGAAPAAGGQPEPANAAQAARPGPPSTTPSQPADLNALIKQAAQQMTDYQRLTAEGKLGDAGAKLQELKQTLDALSKRSQIR